MNVDRANVTKRCWWLAGVGLVVLAVLAVRPERAEAEISSGCPACEIKVTEFMIDGVRAPDDPLVGSGAVFAYDSCYGLGLDVQLPTSDGQDTIALHLDRTPDQWSTFTGSHPDRTVNLTVSWDLSKASETFYKDGHVFVVFYENSKQ